MGKRRSTLQRGNAITGLLQPQALHTPAGVAQVHDARTRACSFFQVARKKIHAPRLLKNHDVDRQATSIVRKPCGRWEELEASCWWTCGRSWKHPVGGHVACGAPAPSLAPKLTYSLWRPRYLGYLGITYFIH